MISLYKYLYFSLPRLMFLKNSKGNLYLDFGCGDGLALRQNLAVRPDLKCFAIDVKDFSKQLPNYIIFTVYKGGKLPYHDNIFDIITSNHVLEHIDNPEMTLSELKRITKVGG